MDKDFIYNDELGWNWHKSWNLPDFKCQIVVNFLYFLKY